MLGLPELKKVLYDIKSNSCPYEINLHCHTTFSDGSLEPIDLFKQAIKYKLKHIAITDHHNIDAYECIQQWIERNYLADSNVIDLPILWSGIEISCLLKNCLVHILGYGFDLKDLRIDPYIHSHSTTGSNLLARSVINAIHDSGGLAILAHPARYRLGFAELIEAAANLGIDGAEAWYDYDYNKNWSPTYFVCDSINKKLNSLNLLSTCGTDTHGVNIISR